MFCVCLFRTFLCTNSVLLTLTGSVWFICMMQLSKGSINGDGTLSATEVFCILWLLTFVAVQGTLLHTAVRHNEILSGKYVEGSHLNMTSAENNTVPALSVKIILEGKMMHVSNETIAERQYATAKGLLSSWVLWVGHAIGCMYTIFIGTSKNNSETCTGCTVCMCVLHCNCASLFEFALAGTPNLNGQMQHCSTVLNFIFWSTTFICICMYTKRASSSTGRAYNSTIVPLQNLEPQEAVTGT